MPDKPAIYEDMCFVIMPIGEGHVYDHFKHVYDDVFKEAIKNAGFKPKRADDEKSSSMIQVEIIKDIVNAPMAICDLSTRNPNVLFELGIRQAFDLPVVLVQEMGTPRIFDISTINTIEYRKDRIYHEVLEDRKKIEDALNATKDNKKGINSIIKLLEISKAEINSTGKLTDTEEIKVLLFSLANEIENIKKSNAHSIQIETLDEIGMRDKTIVVSKNNRNVVNIESKISRYEKIADEADMITDSSVDELLVELEELELFIKT